MPQKPQKTEERYSDSLIVSGSAPYKWGDLDQRLEDSNRERDAAQQALRKEWRATSWWALGLCIASVGFCIALAGFANFQVSQYASEMRDIRDRITKLEVRSCASCPSR